MKIFLVLAYILINIPGIAQDKKGNSVSIEYSDFCSFRFVPTSIEEFDGDVNFNVKLFNSDTIILLKDEIKKFYKELPYTDNTRCNIIDIRAKIIIQNQASSDTIYMGDSWGFVYHDEMFLSTKAFRELIFDIIKSRDKDFCRPKY